MPTLPPCTPPPSSPAISNAARGLVQGVLLSGQLRAGPAPALHGPHSAVADGLGSLWSFCFICAAAQPKPPPGVTPTSTQHARVDPTRPHGSLQPAAGYMITHYCVRDCRQRKPISLSHSFRSGLSSLRYCLLDRILCTAMPSSMPDGDGGGPHGDESPLHTATLGACQSSAKSEHLPTKMVSSFQLDSTAPGQERSVTALVTELVGSPQLLHNEVGTPRHHLRSIYPCFAIRSRHHPRLGDLVGCEGGAAAAAAAGENACIRQLCTRSKSMFAAEHRPELGAVVAYTSDVTPTASVSTRPRFR